MNAEKPGIGADLGAELRRKREAAGIKSQQELADRLFCDRTMVTKIETGKSVPTDDMLTAWGKECGFDPAPYIVMARHARRPEMALRYFESWLEIEKAAKLIRIWSPMLIPGPVQTEDYIRALCRSIGTDEDTIEGYVAIRLGRRDMLKSARVIILIGEAMLYPQMVGSPAVMADQLQHLLDVSEGPRLSIQVVPLNDTVCGLSGAFDIASGDEFPDTVRMDGIADQISDRRQVVEQATVKFDLLHGYALSRRQSREVITEAMNTWRARASESSSARAVTAITAKATASS